MNYEEVSEIANRAKNIGDSYLNAYNLFIQSQSMTKLECDDLLNELYHVIHASELLSQDDLVIQSKEYPMLLGAGIVISSDIYVSDVAEECEMLRQVIHKLIAKAEEGYFYPKFMFHNDLRKIEKHQKALLSYETIIKRDYLNFIMSLSNRYPSNHTELLLLFKQCKSIQDSYYDRCYYPFYSQKLGEKFNYDEVLNKLFKIKNISKEVFKDILEFEKKYKSEPYCLTALDTLRTHFECLTECANNLRAITLKLAEKANGELSLYTFSQYMEDSNKLNTLMSKLKDTANNLQKAYEQMLYSLSSI